VPIKLTIVKTFTYRGAPEEFSNTYHLTGSDPADDAAWGAIDGWLRAAERLVYTNAVKLTRIYGYNSGSDHADYVHDMSLVDDSFRIGSLAVGTSIPAPGDDAIWVRWPTGALNSKGRKIYLRKYFHDARLSAGGGDAVFPAQKTALQTFGDYVLGSSGPDSRTLCSPEGDVPVGAGVASYITTRTLKRRGKRPPTS
jgi:hypothetical protein